MGRVNDKKLAEKFQEISGYEDYYQVYGAPLVIEAIGNLDKTVDDIKSYQKRVRDLNLEFDAPSLEQIVIDLSSCIYYTTDKLEKLQLMADISKMSYKNTYNNAYITKQGNHDAGTKYSVQQLQAYSENEALEDNIINFIYSRAAKEVENKLDAARELLKATSKSLSGVIASMQTYQYGSKYST